MLPGRRSAGPRDTGAVRAAPPVGPESTDPDLLAPGGTGGGPARSGPPTRTCTPPGVRAAPRPLPPDAFPPPRRRPAGARIRARSGVRPPGRPGRRRALRSPGHAVPPGSTAPAADTGTPCEHRHTAPGGGHGPRSPAARTGTAGRSPRDDPDPGGQRPPQRNIPPGGPAPAPHRHRVCTGHAGKRDMVPSRNQPAAGPAASENPRAPVPATSPGLRQTAPGTGGSPPSPLLPPVPYVMRARTAVTATVAPRESARPPRSPSPAGRRARR
ncbi:protein transport protein SEC31 [Nocardiopsis flavescens]|uniref:Protein transport protein SEC31 n=1 Tax=Nocardiopsis flavescens TaxID=758803 RepID=A0A1M6CFY7_9ACTN|nr:protein transport protein SEC31 [Nocardiopsis flavescens]